MCVGVGVVYVHVCVWVWVWCTCVWVFGWVGGVHLQMLTQQIINGVRVLYLHTVLYDYDCLSSPPALPSPLPPSSPAATGSGTARPRTGQ